MSRDTRKRYSSNNICRAWTDQESEDGRCPASMSFEGLKFYSYYTVIAEIAKHHGERVFFVSTETYSNTTARHLREVEHAIRRTGARTFFHVPGVERGRSNLADFDRIFADWQKQAERKLEQAEAAQREIKRSRLIVEAYELVCKMRELAEFFHLPLDEYQVKLPAPNPTAAGEEVYARILALRLTGPSPWMSRPQLESAAA